MKNNYYMVNVEITIEGYEKEAYHLVCADDLETAKVAALEGESHNQDAGYDKYMDWWDSDILMGIGWAKCITPEDAKHYERITTRSMQK